MPETAARRSNVVQIADEFYILASSGRVDDRTRVLKQGETFAVLDRLGDIHALGFSELGLYHEGTRFLSHLELRLMDERPLLLSSTIKDDNALLAVDLTNGDVTREGEIVVPRGTLHIFRGAFLWEGCLHQRLRVTNYGASPVTISLALSFDADFVDIFEVRGTRRVRRGERLPETVGPGETTLAYEGLDGVVRRTLVNVEPAPPVMSAGEVEFSLTLAPQASETVCVAITCSTATRRPPVVAFDDAFRQAGADLIRRRTNCCSVVTANEQMNDLLNRASADLAMMLTDTGHGVYPYAGVPWYSTAFGRDGIFTALEYLWLDPEMARGVLQFLAHTQADAHVPESDAEPGKILHETRRGEMAALGEIPFRLYYGSADTTPLFIVLAGAYYARTGDRALLEELWPNIERALTWIDRHGDRDGDGLVEYYRRSATGLTNQGWKDSVDSIFHADGRLAEGPIAVCEVQGYVYEAKRVAASLSQLRGDHARAKSLSAEAERVRKRIEDTFWCEELGTYALALDGEKQPCRVAASNAAHLLFSGVPGDARARRVAAELMSDRMYSGWGLRTVATSAARYNPMSYHNGSVWPHDNAIACYGLSRYGMRAQVGQLLGGLLDASLWFELHRVPELFCGFRRRPGEGPTLYPVACSPQSWAAAAPFLMLQSLLGLEIDAPAGRVQLTDPLLPPYLTEMEVRNLRVGEGVVDFDLMRNRDDVVVAVRRKEGPIRVVVVK